MEAIKCDRCGMYGDEDEEVWESIIGGLIRDVTGVCRGCGVDLCPKCAGSAKALLTKWWEEK
jgi:hypothetical protein